MSAHPDMTDDLDEIVAALLQDSASATILATIWATVDRERAASAAGADGRDLPGDEHLGAFVTLVEQDVAQDVGQVGAAQPPIALVEPSTEGRLAAWLARNGEGPAGRYVGVGEGEAFDRLTSVAARVGIGFSPVAGGPFGPSRLVVGRPLTAPNLVLVDRRAGTIGR